MLVTEGTGTTIPSPSSTSAASYGKIAPGVTRPPVCRRDPKPELPAISRSLGEEGQVRLRLLIGTDGVVRSVKVMQSSGYGRLDDAARKTLLRWRCQPALRQGEPAEAELEETVVFELK
ncbi:energy transducer TonB [Formivibrio citricus]|uniref:energy transducer TonB n=1 Tax=Formivibrio citricus TaxID=83765 RepID=UPI0015A56CB6|nr:energy transducer TonB [Formivibrio citricus]